MAKKIRTYYTLFCLERDGKWYPQFGDFSRAVVTDESRDSYSREYKARDRKIVKHAYTRDALEAVQAALNATRAALSS